MRPPRIGGAGRLPVGNIQRDGGLATGNRAFRFV